MVGYGLGERRLLAAISPSGLGSFVCWVRTRRRELTSIEDLLDVFVGRILNRQDGWRQRNDFWLLVYHRFHPLSWAFAGQKARPCNSRDV